MPNRHRIKTFSRSVGKPIELDSEAVEKAVVEFIELMFTLPPQMQTEFLQRCTHTKRPSDPSINKINFCAFAELISETLDAKISRKVVTPIVEAYRRKQLEVSRNMWDKAHNKRESYRVVAAALDASSLSLSQSESPEDKRNRIKAAIDILNVVRLAASDVLPNDYAEGVADFDPHITDDLITLGAMRSKSSEALPGLLSRFISALQHACDDRTDTIEASAPFELVILGHQLCLVLAGRRNRIGLLAELNRLTIGKLYLGADVFVEQAQRICDEALAADASSEEYGDTIEQLLEASSPEGSRFPGLRRIAAFALNNAITLAQGELVRRPQSDEAGLDAIRPLIDKLGMIVETLALNDGLVLFWELITLLQKCLAAELFCKSDELLTTLHQTSPGRLGELVAFARMCEDDRELVRLVSDAIFTAYPYLRNEVLGVEIVW